MLDVGETIERYEVEALLGSGGIAAVYRVRHRQLGTAHALKVLMVTTPVDKQRLLAEGQVQARLQHANVVAVTDVLLVNRSPALVMELVDGPSLDVWLQEGRVPVDVALTLFRGVVAGVGAAHAVGLVHRDLKPSNVLVGRGPTGAMALKVTDFGLVRLLGDQATSHAASRTKTGAAIGTPAYMAPEQIRDPSGVDGRADLWGLGCLLYEVVCGRRAFPMEDPFALYEAIAAGSYDDPVIHAPNAPHRVLAAIQALLQVDREERLASCAALWERLWDDPPPMDFADGKAPLSLDGPLTLAGQTPAPMPRAPADKPQGLPLWAPIVGGIGTAAFVCLGALTLPLVLPGPVSEPSDPALGREPIAVEVQTVVNAGPPRETIEVAEPSALGRKATQPPAEAAVVAVREPQRVFAPTPVARNVHVAGDAREVWLQAGGERFDVAKAIPAGRYQVGADWSDRRVANAGSIEVVEGQRTTLRCASFLYACTVISTGPLDGR